MSSKSLDKKFQEKMILDGEKRVELKNLVIPFSKFSIAKKYIYYGHEKVPFKKRHSTYQIILRHEFAEEMKEFMTSLKK